MRKHPNLLKSLRITRPKQVFVSDITYLESKEGVHYLSLVTDASSRKIMGYHLSDDMKAESVVKALQSAVKNRVTANALVHHSDRGLQYCSDLYQKELKQHSIQASMTDGYDCYQNALAELEEVLHESIFTNNNLSYHMSLGMQTPEEAHKKASF